VNHALDSQIDERESLVRAPVEREPSSFLPILFLLRSNSDSAGCNSCCIRKTFISVTNAAVFESGSHHKQEKTGISSRETDFHDSACAAIGDPSFFTIIRRI
jgi:hypothetical protein